MCLVCIVINSRKVGVRRPLPYLVCSILRVKRKEIVNFMTARFKGRYRFFWVKLMYFLAIDKEKLNIYCSNDDQGIVYLNCIFHKTRGCFAKAWPY